MNSALPPNAILAHVGMPKTGSSALQAQLAARRPQLSEHGVLYPGEDRQQTRAAFALLGRTAWIPRPGVQPPRPSDREWVKMAVEARAHTGRVIISSEYLSDLRGAARRRFVEDLDPDRLHIMIGVRHLAAVAGSIWQQSLKRGRSLTFERWLQNRFRDRSPGQIPPTFWSRYDYAETVRAWVEAVGPDRVHVVVIESSSRERQPATVEQLLGLPDRTLVDAPVDRSNRSLTAAEAEGLRRANVILRDELPWREYEQVISVGAIDRMVERRQPGPEEARLTVPQWAVELADQDGAEAAEAIAAMPVVVHGDLGALSRSPVAGRPDGEKGAAPTMVPVEVLAQALAGALQGAAYGRASDSEGLRPRESGMVTATGSRELLRVVARRGRLRVARLTRRSQPEETPD